MARPSIPAGAGFSDSFHHAAGYRLRANTGGGPSRLKREPSLDNRMYSDDIIRNRIVADAVKPLKALPL